MQRGGSDWLGAIAAYAAVILVNVLSNVLPINGQSMVEISARYPSLFTPAGFTFSIWGVIYLLLLVYVVYQALPSQRQNPVLAGLNKLFVLTCAANVAWILVWHYDLLVLSLIVMFALLALLVRIYRYLGRELPARPLTERFIVGVPFSIYCAWITLATIANVSAIQTGYGWDDVMLGAIAWTLLKLALAGAVGVAVLWRREDLAFGVVVAWAAYGISVMQASTPAVAGAAIMLAILTTLTMALVVVRRAWTRAGQ
jgi:hypothetical protein